MEQPFVSIVMPCRNEQAWIQGCLESIDRCDYPKDRLEILVADGMSDDRTREIVEAFAADHPHVRLLDNPRRSAPAAMNVGIRAARGEILMRMDAHCVYPRNYISSLVAHLTESGADNVGGVWLTRAAGPGAIARGIAAGLAHPLGVGNAYFRIGCTAPRWVDTVPFGCYRRKVFDRIGLFDEELIRNQDDELNLRLKNQGGRILLVPDVQTTYYARDSLRKLWRMYYQYGYFKPLVVKKVGGVRTFRQLVPSLFLLALAFAAILTLIVPATWWLLAGIGASYLTTLLAGAISVGWHEGPTCGAAMLLVFPTLHFAYGYGYLHGAAKLMKFGKGERQPLADIPLSR